MVVVLDAYVAFPAMVSFSVLNSPAMSAKSNVITFVPFIFDFLVSQDLIGFWQLNPRIRECDHQIRKVLEPAEDKVEYFEGVVLHAFIDQSDQVKSCQGEAGVSYYEEEV
jgi:hypothetical protein